MMRVPRASHNKSRGSDGRGKPTGGGSGVRGREGGGGQSLTLDMSTLEQLLDQQCEKILQANRQHAQGLLDQLEQRQAARFVAIERSVEGVEYTVESFEARLKAVEDKLQRGAPKDDAGRRRWTLVSQGKNAQNRDGLFGDQAHDFSSEEALGELQQEQKRARHGGPLLVDQANPGRSGGCSFGSLGLRIRYWHGVAWGLASRQRHSGHSPGHRIPRCHPQHQGRHAWLDQRQTPGKGGRDFGAGDEGWA